jgi:hypothetical protein
MHVAFPVAFLSTSETARPARLPWLDSSFANMQRSPTIGSDVSGLYTARNTIEICALGYLKYTVWAFADALHEGEPLALMDESEFNYEGPNEENPMIPIHEDPIAVNDSIDANEPIMDCRAYSLQMFASQVDSVCIRWQDAVGLFKDPFSNHV